MGRPAVWGHIHEVTSEMGVDEVITVPIEEGKLNTAQTAVLTYVKRVFPHRLYRAVTAAGKLYIIRAF